MNDLIKEDNKKYHSSKNATKLFGVTSQTLRRCNQVGKLEPAYTRDNGFRDYAEEDIFNDSLKYCFYLIVFNY